MHTPAHSIEHYIHAKDGNRPDLLRHCFTPDASLEMTVRTATIAFPAQTSGRSAIADVLVSNFARTYENVYTLCIGQPPAGHASTHACQWLVGMSVKASGELRIGCGDYLWQFVPGSGLVRHLSITIEDMQVYAAQDLEPVMNWLQSLSYPWCMAQDLVRSAPAVGDLESILKFFKS